MRLYSETRVGLFPRISQAMSPTYIRLLSFTMWSINCETEAKALCPGAKSARTPETPFYSVADLPLL